MSVPHLDAGIRHSRAIPHEKSMDAMQSCHCHSDGRGSSHVDVEVCVLEEGKVFGEEVVLLRHGDALNPCACSYTAKAADSNSASTMVSAVRL